MSDLRLKRAKQNIAISLAGQAVTIVCGMVVPHLTIAAFGSEAYGAVSSITQFLAYITLLEGGIGAVAKAALYGPLAENNSEVVNSIIQELRTFFKIITTVFVAYTIVLACTFTYISDVQIFDWCMTFMLVIAISISNLAQFCFAITDVILLQAAQKAYISNGISIATTILNALLTILLIDRGASLLAVKMTTSVVFLIRPIIIRVYAKKKYNLHKLVHANKSYLTQKWTGAGQHLAYFLHSNTDITILTIFADLNLVAVYTVYNMVIAHIQSFVISFSSGMEALFGDMLTKREIKELSETFSRYETLLSIVAVILLATTAVMIVPFVEIYTEGITDAEYYAPLFALLMVLSSLLYCLRNPYHAVITAAGHFSQTKFAAYGEAIINICLSVILVKKCGLVGVAIGTLIATAFRFLYYVNYLSKNIIYRNIRLFVKRIAVNGGIFIFLEVVGQNLLASFSVGGYLEWIVCGAVLFVVNTAVTIAFHYLFYKKDLLALFKKNR